MITQYTTLKSNTILFFLIAFGLFTKALGQQPTTVSIIVESGAQLVGGAQTTCEGSVVQLKAIAEPANANYNYNWTSSTTGFINNMGTNGGSGNGDASSFIRIAVTERTTFSVQVAGINAPQPITIEIEPTPNAGNSNTVFLCNKTGTLNLISFLGTADPGGTWTRADGSTFNGQFNVATDTPGVFTYTVNGAAVCTDTNASITIKPCGELDFDNDGVLNAIDLDDDNDGILDTEESSYCATPASFTETQFSLEEDFGIGNSTTNNFVSPLLGWYIGAPQDDFNAANRGNPDGEYNVATSSHILTFNGENAIFMATDLNGNEDADQNTEGRYLAINMKTATFGLTQPIYTQTDLPVIQGATNILSMSIASLSNNIGEESPNLRIEIIDAVTKAQLNPPIQVDTGLIPNGTDIWTKYDIPFTPPANVIAVDVRVINLQTAIGNGNDVGIDNIFLSTLECDFDRDAIANSADLDSDNDGIYDLVEAGRGDLDANGDGIVDGAVDANGIPIAAAGGINPINSDTDGNDDYLDIDSDNDGIIDNLEGQTTVAYRPPTGIDNDFDGVDDAYDTLTGTPLNPFADVDTNGNGTPDYLDLNSDILTATDGSTTPGDCLDDTTEAYDVNQDGIADIVISGTDTDNDGLDDAFDNISLQRITQNTNATNGGTLPADFPDAHDPGGDRDWREEFSGAGGAPIEESVCIGGGTINLFDFLLAINPSTSTTGTWTVPAGAPTTTGGNLGTIDPSTVTPGTSPATNPVFTYVYGQGTTTINGCPSKSTNLEITFTPTPFAGTDNTAIAGNGNPVIDLIDLLQAATPTPTVTPGGTWSPTLEVNGQFNTAAGSTDVFGQAYMYTVGTGTCEQTATVIINNCTPPSVPANPMGQSICSGNALTAPLSVDAPQGADEVIRWYDAAVAGTDLMVTSREYTPPTLPTTTTSYFAETFDTTSNCASMRVEVILTVNQRPQLETPADVTVCEGTYNLPPLNEGVYYDATGGPGATELNPGDPITTTQTVFIYAETLGTTGCSSEVSFEITVSPIPTATAPADFTSCGIAMVPNLPNVQFYTQPGGLGEERLPGGVVFETETLYVVETVNGCSSTNDPSFTITVIEDSFVDLGPDQTICLDEFGTPISSVELFADLDNPALYDFEWTKDGSPFGSNDDFISTTEPGTYELSYSLRGSNCSFSAIEPVIIDTIEGLSAADILLNDGSQVSISDNTITVTITKPGTYEYSLDDDFSYQDSNVFTKVPFGLHTVFVRSVIGGCTPAFVDIQLVGFPKFFTPNDDFENPTWNIVDINRDLPNMTISIFDRYGKLLKTITPQSVGWNGTYNGQPMPATDYWFLAQLEDGTQFRNHFSLIR